MAGSRDAGVNQHAPVVLVGPKVEAGIGHDPQHRSAIAAKKPQRALRSVDATQCGSHAAAVQLACLQRGAGSLVRGQDALRAEMMQGHSSGER